MEEAVEKGCLDRWPNGTHLFELSLTAGFNALMLLSDGFPRALGLPGSVSPRVSGDSLPISTALSSITES
jgi:hypothetical protein